MWVLPAIPYREHGIVVWIADREAVVAERLVELPVGK